MKNKTLAVALLTSFLVIFLGAIDSIFSEFFYGAGALGTLVFGGLTLSRLFILDKHYWLPMFGGIVMFVFWTMTFVAPEGIGLLSSVYLITLVWSGIQLYHKQTV